MNHQRIYTGILLFLLFLIGATLHSLAKHPELWMRTESSLQKAPATYIEIDPSVENAKICVDYNGATITYLDTGKEKTASKVWIYEGHDFSVKINDSIYSNFVNSTELTVVELMQVIPDPDNDRVIAVAEDGNNGVSFIGYYYKGTPKDCFTVGPDLKQK